MTNWLNIAGGAAQGAVEGSYDNQRRAEFEFLQQQRRRALEQQKIEDEADAAYRSVRPAGTYEDEDRSAMLPGEVGPSPKTKITTRTEKDAARDQIAALSRGGARQRQEGLLQKQAMNQQEQFDFMMHQQKVSQAAMRAAMLADTNPVAAMQFLSQQYDMVPDGQKLVVQQGPGGQFFYGVADQSGRWVPGYQPRPVTAEEAKKMAGTAMTFATPEMYKMTKGAQIAERGVGVQERNATTAEKYKDWVTVGEGGRSEVGLRDAQAARQRALSADESRPFTFGAPVQYETEDGSAKFGIPVQNKKTGDASWKEMPLPAGAKPMKKPPTMNDQQKEAYKVLMKKEENGEFKNAAERDAFIDAYGLRDVVGGKSLEDKIAGRANSTANAGQGEQTGGPNTSLAAKVLPSSVRRRLGISTPEDNYGLSVR